MMELMHYRGLVICKISECIPQQYYKYISVKQGKSHSLPHRHTKKAPQYTYTKYQEDNLDKHLKFTLIFIRLQSGDNKVILDQEQG